MQKRYVSLDVLRGLTVAMMIIVNNPGSWSRIFPFLPFKALGMNALAIFVVSGLLMKVLWRYIGWDYSAIFGTDEYMSLLFALIYLAPHLLLAIWLYKKKIFIKL